MSRNVPGIIIRASQIALLLLAITGSFVTVTRLTAQNLPTPFLAPSTPYVITDSTDHRFVATEVLTDTRGVNIGPYISQVMQTISKGHSGLMSQTGSDPDQTSILTVTITRSGAISTLHLDQSSHDVGLDRAAWQSILEARPLPPLPEEFSGTSLRLRVHYRAATKPVPSS